MFLPYYLPQSTLLQKPALGAVALILWIVGQVGPARVPMNPTAC